MGFKQYLPPTDLPPEIRQTIAELENKTTDQKTFLQLAYNLLASKYDHGRYNVVRFLPRLFRTDLEQIWNSTGYAHCTTRNYVLFTLLANSKYFKPEDVRVRHQFFNFVPHQYLQVKVDGIWTDADPGGSYKGGVVLGKHASWFW